MRTRTKRGSWRGRAASEGGGGVNLISMMDVLTVLLLFLLKSYVSGGEVMVPPAGVQLPASSAEAMPQASLVVAIDGDEIVVGSESVASIPEIERSSELEIAALATHLQSERSRQDEVARARGEEPPTSYAATIQGDRDIEFRVLQKVMYTLHQNGYESIALAVLQKT
jgi:biopolymer transport protein ExbD